MIGFEAPLALLGTALVVVPIVLHALVRRAPPVAVLPTARFLDELARPRRRFARPSDLVLLLLRILGLGALSIAAARPFARASALPVAAPALVVVLDDSFSMSAGSPRSRFERARSELLLELAALPPGSRAALVTTTRVRSVELETVERVRARLGKAAPQPRSASLVPALEAAAELAREQPVRVVVASDLDRASLDGLERRSEAARRLGPRVIDVGDDGPPNAWFASVELTPGTPVAGFPARVRARVAATGLDRAAEIEVALETSGVRSLEHVRPGESATFELPRVEPGLFQGSLTLRAPGDALEADDRLAFGALVRPALEVVVAGERAAQHGVELEPVARALEAIGEARRAPIHVAVRAPSELARGLEGVRMLVLVAPGALDAATQRAVEGFVERGGGLAVWLDQSKTTAAWRFLQAHERAGPSVVRLRPEEGALESELGRALEALAVEPSVELEPAPGDRVLVRDDRGAPVWIESGRKSLVAFAPSGKNEGLARETVFPLLVRRTLANAVGAWTGLETVVGEPLDRRELARACGLAAGDLGSIEVVAPTSGTSELGAGPLVPEEPGVHRLASKAGELLAVFAARPSESESSLERASPAARAALARVDDRPESARATEAPREDVTALAVAAGLAGLLLGSLVSNRRIADEGRRS